jgi:hypothetical protein
VPRRRHQCVAIVHGGVVHDAQCTLTTVVEPPDATARAQRLSVAPSAARETVPQTGCWWCQGKAH